MSLSATLRSRHQATWDAAVRHRFVDELLDGSLDDDVLTRYLVQDYQFCDAFTALLGQACASAPALPQRLRYAAQLGMFASDENTYFVDSFDALGIGAGDRTAPELLPATRAFDEVMRSALESRSYAQVLAVLLVAEWVYLDWAERAPATPTATRPEHVGWIDLHRGDDFAGWVAFLRSELDACAPLGAQEGAVDAIFGRAVRCEVDFFDAAYA